MTDPNIDEALALGKWVEVEFYGPIGNPRDMRNFFSVTCMNRNGYIQSFITLEETKALHAYLSAVILAHAKGMEAGG